MDKMKNNWIVIVTIIILVLAVFALLYFGKNLGEASKKPRQASFSVTRSLPSSCRLNENCQVKIIVTVTAGIANLGIQDQIPNGWRFVDSQPRNYAIDQEKGLLAWIFGNIGEPVKSQIITYTVIPTTKNGKFTGSWITLPDEKKGTIECSDRVRVK